MKVDMDAGLKIAAWMKDKIKRFQCPVCQHLVWNTSEDIYTLTSDSGPFKPKGVVTLQCANCASLTFFDAASIGIAAIPTTEVKMEMKNSPTDALLAPVLDEIQQHFQKHPPAWLSLLKNDPASLAKLDQEIHLVFAHLADKMVAGLKAASAEEASAASKQK